MWITTVTIDINRLAQITQELRLEAAALRRQHTNQLKEIDGNGQYIPGFEHPDMWSTPVAELENLIVKRTWNTQSAATEHASFLQNLNVGWSASVEEQV
jgi:hypothetical protein